MKILSDFLSSLNLNMFDLKIERIDFKGEECALVYLESLVNKDKIISLYSSLNNDNFFLLQEKEIRYEFSFISFFNGNALLFYKEKIYAFDFKEILLRGISEPLSEKTIKGAKDGFNEDLLTNLSLIRRRIKSPFLCVDSFCVGRNSKTIILLLYMENLVNKELVKEIENRINKIDISSLIMTDKALEEKLINNNFNFFPLVKFSERSDLASSSLMNEKVVILVENSSSSIILPITLFDHFYHVEEFRQNRVVGSFTRIIRFISCLFSFLILPLYYCLIEKAPFLNLLLILKHEEASVSSFSQCLGGIIVLEIFRLAIVHTPSPLVSALSLVSAILVGEVSLKFGLFSEDILLFLALSTIGGYAQATYELSLANKIEEIILLILCACFGSSGLLIGILVFFIMLSETKLFNKPYLAPLCPLIPNELINLLIRPSSKKRKNV